MSTMTLELKRDDECLWLHVSNGKQHGMFNLGKGLRDGGNETLAVQLLREYIDAHFDKPAQAVETVRAWPKFVQDECLEVLRNMDTELGATGRKSARIERLINAIAGMPAQAVDAYLEELARVNDAKSRAISGEKAGPVDGWISVKERLPERNKPAIYWHKSEFGGFAAIADEWSDEHHLAQATHWMPYIAPASPAPDKEGL
jgi:hypothetical protein